MTDKVTVIRRDDMPMPLISFAAPEHLAQWYAGGLLHSLERGERRLAIACFDVEAIFGFGLSRTAELVLEAVMDVLRIHPEAESLEIACSGEACWRTYRACWERWRARAER